MRSTKRTLLDTRKEGFLEVPTGALCVLLIIIIIILLLSLARNVLLLAVGGFPIPVLSTPNLSADNSAARSHIPAAAPFNAHVDLTISTVFSLQVASPLEAYIVVFMVWSIPAIVMTTDRCEQQTSLHLTVGCQHICQMLLSLRPLSTAAVFFMDSGRRAELRNIKGTMALTSIRLLPCVAPFRQDRLCSAAPCGLHHAARYRVLIGVRSALVCPCCVRTGASGLTMRVWLRLYNFAAWAAGKREIAGRRDRVRYRAELEHVKVFDKESTVAERDGSSSTAEDGSGSVGAGISYELMADLDCGRTPRSSVHPE